MITATTIALALTAMLAQGPAAVSAADDLSAVKDLYASASFEEALTRLAGAEERLGKEQTEQYRALCLLGLGRTDEAESSLERMVAAKPLYSIPESDVSPRLIAMFREVRKRMLPATARELYAKAKADYDARQYASAAAQFRDMLAVVNDADMGDRAADLSDLKMLGEGFLKLADGEVVAAARAAQAAAAARAAAAAPAAPAAPPVPVIYSADDTSVVPPADIERRLPMWNPPTVMARTTEYRGMLELVIDERGVVESAVLRKTVAPTYDPLLLIAAKAWKFQPATRNGVPVKYRKNIDILLAPQR